VFGSEEDLTMNAIVAIVSVGRRSFAGGAFVSSAFVSSSR
jgi:hypothetical protein